MLKFIAIKINEKDEKKFLLFLPKNFKNNYTLSVLFIILAFLSFYNIF